MSSLVRYVVVGVVATAVHYTLLIAAVEGARWPAWMATGLAAVVGAQVAYVGNRVFTFGHRGTVLSSWPRFQITALMGAAVSMGLVALSVSAGLHYLVGQVLATLTAMVLTYLVNRHWTFAPTAASPASRRRH